MNSRFKHARSFFEFLVRENLVQRNPTDGIDTSPVARAARNMLTLSELAALWNAAEGRERVIVGLIGLCGMGRDEVRDARAEHLHVRAETLALTVPGRTGAKDLGYVALPDQLALAIREQLGERRTGIIVRPARGGSGRVSRDVITDTVARVARRAGIPFHVKVLDLAHTLRSLALELRFSYASVVRTAGQGSDLSRIALVRNLDLPPREHASMRLGRVLAARSSDDDAMLLRAEELLADKYQHPVAATLIASATLERVLREVTQDCGIGIAKKDPTINTYATNLRSAGHITIAHLRTMDRIMGLRNSAAHGWFERVSADDAGWVVKEVSALIPELRAIGGARSTP